MSNPDHLGHHEVLARELQYYYTYVTGDALSSAITVNGRSLFTANMGACRRPISPKETVAINSFKQVERSADKSIRQESFSTSLAAANV
jgi:hypothetical protein